MRRMLKKIVPFAVVLMIAMTLPGSAVAQTTFCAPPAPTPKDKPQPDNPPSCGDKQCEKCNASPCFAKTGVYTTQTTDLQIPTNGFPLTVTRSYESWHAVDGAVGYGWSSNLGARIYYASYLVAAPNVLENEAIVVMPDGETYRYKENTDGTFKPPVGRRDSLVRSGDGSFEMTLQGSSVRYGFAPDGALVTMRDEYGNTLRFTLDAGRRVSRVDDESGTGRHLIVTWNPSGRIGNVQDNAGRFISYSYNSNGTLAGFTDAAGRTTTYTYEARRFAPLLSQIRDHWSRVVTDITWDSLDRVRTYSELGEVYTMDYYADQAQPLSVKSHSLGAQSITYDASGLVTSRGAGTTAYTPHGDVELVTDSAGRKTRYTYSPDGRLLTTTFNEGATKGVGDVSFHYAYDPTFPNKVASIEPHVANWSPTVFNGHWRGWKYTYYTLTDPTTGQLAGALKQVERMAYQDQTNTVLTQDCGLTCLYATFKYDAKGRVVSAWNRQDTQTGYLYDDALNRLTVSRPHNGTGVPSTTYQFDSLGRTASVTDALGSVTSYQYDPLDRVTHVTLPKPSATSTLNFLTTYAYDQAGTNPGLTYTHVTDPNGRTTKQGYDQFGRVVESIDASGNITRYAYASGLLSSITDANGNVTAYTYDAQRMLQKTTFPGGATELYTHYPEGQLKSKTDRKGVTTTYSYDAYGRLQSEVTGSQRRDFTYQGEKLTFTSDSYSGVTEHNDFTYDPKTLLVTSERQGASGTTTRGTVTYTWDPNYDRIATYAVTDGGSNRTAPVTAYSYNQDGSVAWLTWSHVAGYFNFTYDLNGQVTEIAFPNGQKRKYTYDRQGRVTDLTNRHGVTNLASFVYGYDRDEETGLNTMLGQRTKVTASVPAWPTPNVVTSYSYDGTGQLVKARTGTSERSWTYDAIGNRLTRTSPGLLTTYSYILNPTGQNTSRLAPSSGATHDANGNMTAYGGTAFSWDARDRLSQLDGTYTFKYDFQDRRVAVDHQSTKYIYNGLDPVAISYSLDGGYYLADYLFAPGIDQPLARGDYYGVTYYSVDALGSVILLTDSSGAVKNSYSYDAWGELQWQAGSIVQPFTYTGREFAVLNGPRNYYYYRARTLMPSMGRFLSEDPLGYGEDINPYRYVTNSPVVYTDPSGHQLYEPGPKPPPGVPPGCTAGPWAYTKHILFSTGFQKKWKLVSSKPQDLPGIPKKNFSSLKSGLCTCVYQLSGYVKSYQRWEIWERNVDCCSGSYVENGMFNPLKSEVQEGVIMKNPPPTTTKVGLWNAAFHSCICPP